MTKRTILIFNRGYLPGEKFGGVVRSLHNFTNAFHEEYNLKIVAWDHDFDTQKRYPNITEGWNPVGNAHVLYLPNSSCNFSNFSKIIQQENPLFCYLSGTITAYFGFNAGVLKACKNLGVPAVIAPRGDLCDNALQIKKWKKLAAIAYCKCLGIFQKVFFQSTSAEETKNLKKYFSIKDSSIFEIPNIPALICPQLDKQKTVGQLEVAFVSRISKKKNLSDAIRSVCRAKNHVLFDIYGPLEDEKYWANCLELIKQAPKHITIRYRGALSGEEAKEIFKRYDTFLFETYSENYGHVIIESLLCGCPIILSKGTTPWDDLNGEAGYVAPLGDIDAFASCLDKIANLTQEEYQQLRENAWKYAINKVNIKQLLTAYKNMFSKIKTH